MILITGGARSGKSSVAETIVKQLAQQCRVLYIATSNVFDDEMAERVKQHQVQRPVDWITCEGYRNLDDVIRHFGEGVILLECITTLLSNLLFDEVGDTPPEEMDFIAIEQVLNRQIDQLLAACATCASLVVIVTNELGLGIVPENRLARHFRDIAGRVNQRLAQQADEVYFVVSGIKMKIKG